MHRAGLNRRVRIVLIVFLALVATASAGAQTPALDQTQRATIAAIPLISSDLPDGYLFAGEGFLVETAVSGITGVDAATLNGAGFGGMYLTTYQRADGTGSLTSYVSIWPDAAAAEQGFTLLEDELVTAPDSGSSDASLDAGTGSGELTTGTIEANGATVAVSDATFVVDRYVVGVVVQAPADKADKMVDDAGMQTLVKTLDARATAVVKGDAPEGTDLALPPTVLDIRPLGAEVQAGFLSAGETEALYGVSGSVLSQATASWVAGIAAGDEGAAPFVVVAGTSFADADTAARAVTQSADLVPVQLDLQPVEFAIDGADNAAGYQYASTGGADGVVDSFRGFIQVGTTVYVIDVQGVASPEIAQTAVTALLAAQVSCAGGNCQLPEVTLAG